MKEMFRLSGKSVSTKQEKTLQDFNLSLCTNKSQTQELEINLARQIKPWAKYFDLYS
jgi:hypothetical protein